MQGRVQFQCERDHRARTCDVRGRLFLADGQVVDRAEVQDVLGRRHRGGVESESRFGEIAEQRVQPGPTVQAPAEGLELRQRRRPDQHMDVGVRPGPEQSAEHVRAEETGAARDEVRGHGPNLLQGKNGF